MRRIAFFFLFFIGSITLLSQPSAKRIKVENANSLLYDARQSSAQKLIGNVIFFHENTRLYCDSAYLFDAENRLEAFSNVRIIANDTLQITGNYLQYEGNTRLARIQGKVLMNEPNTQLETDVLQYYLDAREARYTTGGKIVGKKDQTILTSEFGTYKATERTFYFYRNVKLHHPDYVMKSDTLRYNTQNSVAYFLGPTTIISKENKIYCENGYYNTLTDISEFGRNAFLQSKTQTIRGNSLYYNRKTKFGKASGDVLITDSLQKANLSAQLAYYYGKQEKVVLTGKAMLAQELDGDTLFLHADTLRSILNSDSTTKNISAWNRCQFYKSDLSGRCDSLNYNQKDSLMQLFQNPVLWNDENQMSAVFIKLRLKNNQPDSLFMYQMSFIASLQDTGRYNQIKGRNITGIFDNKYLRKLIVNGNGQSIYYSMEKDSSYTGINKIECTDMLIYLDSNQVQRISFLSQPDAQFYTPNSLSHKEFILRGFKWQGHLRPRRKEDIFNWMNL